MTVYRIVLACLFAAMIGLPSLAGDYQLAHKFERERPEPGDFFGTAVAFERDVVAIKSDSGYFDGDGISVTHVFEKDTVGSGWLEKAALKSDNGDRTKGSPFFGQELAIDNGELIIGFGPRYNKASSQCLQFATRGELFGWTTEYNARPQRSPGQPLPLFALVGNRTAGRTVGISGRLAIADEPGAERRDSGKGVARVYEKGDDGWWRETANLAPPNDDHFDVQAADIDGTTAAIVDRGFGPDGGQIAGLFFFERKPDGAWEPSQSFRTNRHGLDYFCFVKIDKNTTVTRNLSYGTVTVYERENGVWRQTAELPRRPHSLHSTSGFALEGNLIAQTIGNEADLPLRVEIYRRTAPGKWTLQATIADPEPHLNRHFGASVAIDKGRVLIGAATPFFNGFEGIDRKDIPAGAVFLFEPTP